MIMMMMMMMVMMRSKKKTNCFIEAGNFYTVGMFEASGYSVTCLSRTDNQR